MALLAALPDRHHCRKPCHHSPLPCYDTPRRFQGRATLRDRYVELSLDGWDATGGGGGGIVAPTGDGDGEGESKSNGGNGGSETTTAATAAIFAAVELVESDMPGRDAVDVTVASNDRKVWIFF